MRMAHFVAGSLALLFSAGAAAYPVTYAYSGTITSWFKFSWPETPEEDLAVSRELGFEVGSEFSGLLTYDADVYCGGASELAACIYYGIENHPSWSLSVGDLNMRFTPGQINGSGGIGGYGEKCFCAMGGIWTQEFDPGSVNGWRLDANEPTLGVIIPRPGEEPQPYGGFRIEVGVIPGHTYVLGGKITDFHRVPEPSTLGLLGIGLTGILLTRRRRKN